MNDSEIDPHRARRRRLLLVLAMVVALIGLGDAIYLTVEHLAGRSVKCTVTGGCSKVLSSPYASIFGVPTAGLGALAYFTAFSLATLALFGYRRAETLLGLTVAAMLGITLWLLFVQAFVLKSFCQYCLLSAALTVTLTGLVISAKRFTDRSAAQ